MSIYAAFDAGPPTILASNHGWGDVGRWADDLDAEEFPNLVHLCEHGYCEELNALESEVQIALEEFSPPESVAKTIAILLDLISHNDGALVVTNGMTKELDTPKGLRGYP